MGKLAGKVALIVGGTSGIGYASARLFKAEGATVIVTGASQGNADRAALELGVEAIASDMTSMADIDALIAGIKERHGRIDTLFCSAGISGGIHPFESVDEETYDLIMAVNLKGVFFTVQRALTIMPDGGSVVLTSSISTRRGWPTTSVYTAAKAGITALGRTLASELTGRRIRVNTFVPGVFDTPLLQKFELPEDVRAKRDAAYAKTIPMGRVGNPAEAAKAALYLASDDSSFMTGGDLVVSGGQTVI
jgi:NAD(P)-dependent dehydrogenase (short-subunit alcohol dehydrogenase family)